MKNANRKMRPAASGLVKRIAASRSRFRCLYTSLRDAQASCIHLNEVSAAHLVMSLRTNQWLAVGNADGTKGLNQKGKP